MKNAVKSHQKMLKKMENLIQNVEKENLNDEDKVTEMFYKIHEIRDRIAYFQSGIEEFRKFYQNEIENFFDENLVLSQKNEEMMYEYMTSECQEMEEIVKKQAELYMTMVALNRVQLIFPKNNH